jgi:two-component system CheB/CheR fusion protein
MTMPPKLTDAGLDDGRGDRSAASGRRDVSHLLHLLAAQAPDHAFILMDSASQIVGWRGAAPEMLGYAEAEVLGQPLDFLFTEADRSQGLPQHERDVAATGGRSEDDRWHVRKDGALVWVTGSLVALREDGRITGYAKVISERTHRLAQIETLQNRLSAAQHGLKARDVFFARLAHEVRNALAPILNVVNLLERTAGERVRLPLSIVRRQVGQLQRMMGDLTEAAKVGAGKLQLVKERFDFAADLTEVAEALRSDALAKDQDLVVLTPAMPVAIHADRQRVHQIIFNLLHNAIKYTPEGGHIWAQCTVEGDYGVVKIEDTGIGIAPELLPVIFDLFTQENPGQSEGGFGVGLSLVKDLVDAHHGFVEVSCDGKGKGSTFAVRLPLEPRP